MFLLLVSTVSAVKVSYRSVPEEQQLKYNKIIDKYNTTEIVIIIVYGKSMWIQDGWFSTSRVIQIDKSGLERFDWVMEHEMIHNKYYRKKYGWDLSHDSDCFNNGLNETEVKT